MGRYRPTGAGAVRVDEPLVGKRGDSVKWTRERFDRLWSGEVMMSKKMKDPMDGMITLLAIMKLIRDIVLTAILMLGAWVLGLLHGITLA